MLYTNKEFASVASGLRRLGDTPKRFAGKLEQYGWCKYRYSRGIPRKRHKE